MLNLGLSELSTREKLLYFLILLLAVLTGINTYRIWKNHRGETLQENFSKLQARAILKTIVAINEEEKIKKLLRDPREYVINLYNRSEGRSGAIGSGFTVIHNVMSIGVTGTHVVREWKKPYRYMLYDKPHIVRKEVKTQERSDISTLDVPTILKSALSLGDERFIKEGATIVAVCNPYIFKFPYRTGIIVDPRKNPALWKTTQLVPPLLELTPAFFYSEGMQPGCSGAPVIQLQQGKPRVIGVAKAMITLQGRTYGFFIDLRVLKKSLQVLSKRQHYSY